MLVRSFRDIAVGGGPTCVWIALPSAHAAARRVEQHSVKFGFRGQAGGAVPAGRAEIEQLGAPYRHAARVKVTAKDGRSVEKLLHHRRGSPEKPLKPEEIEYKFRNVVSGCVAKADIDAFVSLVNKLDTMDNTDALTQLMAKPVTVR